MLKLLRNNYDFTYKFNQNIEHRYKLWIDGFMGGKEGMKVLPGIIRYNTYTSSYDIIHIHHHRI